jgi:uncharacterized protein
MTMNASAGRPSRRELLLAAGGTLMLPWLALAQKGPAPANGKRNGTVIGFGLAANKACFICTVDFDSPERTVRSQSDIDFLGHGFMPNPARPHLAVVSQKQGKGCVEWDMAARKVTRVISTVPQRQFYGHGAFTPDGKILFLVETTVGDGSYQGVISVRDGSSYEQLGEFPSYGMAPHDAHLIDGGRTLVVTNGGGPRGSSEMPCVTLVDVGTRQLKRKLVLPERLNAGHVAMTAKGDMAVVSAPRNGMNKEAPDYLGGISLLVPGRDLRTLENEVVARMRGETLSVAIHAPSGVVAATNPAADLLSFWDYSSGKLLMATDQFKDPRGISLTLDQRKFVLTYGRVRPHAVLLDAKTLRPLEDSYVEYCRISGSHNYVYALA